MEGFGTKVKKNKKASRSIEGKKLQIRKTHQDMFHHSCNACEMLSQAENTHKSPQ